MTEKTKPEKNAVTEEKTINQISEILINHMRDFKAENYSDTASELYRIFHLASDKAIKELGIAPPPVKPEPYTGC